MNKKKGIYSKILITDYPISATELEFAINEKDFGKKDGSQGAWMDLHNFVAANSLSKRWTSCPGGAKITLRHEISENFKLWFQHIFTQNLIQKAAYFINTQFLNAVVNSVPFLFWKKEKHLEWPNHVLEHEVFLVDLL